MIWRTGEDFKLRHAGEKEKNPKSSVLLRFLLLPAVEFFRILEFQGVRQDVRKYEKAIEKFYWLFCNGKIEDGAKFEHLI